MLNICLAAVTASRTRHRGSGSFPGRCIATVAVARVAADAVGLPAVTRANLDLICAAGLFVTAAKGARRNAPANRRATLAVGVVLVGLALLTAKPTGPARRIR